MILKLLRGLNIPPTIVGVARGALEMAVIAGLMEAVALLSGPDFTDKWWVLPAVMGLRTVEGLADHIDPEKQRKP